MSRFREWKVLGCTITSLYPYEEWTQPFVPSEHLPGDLFTFWQLYPNTTPHYSYWHEWDRIAIIDTHSHNEWFISLPKKTRNMIRKSQKLGVTVAEVTPSMSFCLAIEKINNETPTRQGRPYRHYHEPLKDVMAGYMNTRSTDFFLAAYYQNAIVAVAQVCNGYSFAFLSAFIGLQQHFDKAVMNALMSDVVKACERHGIKYLAYERISDDSLGRFKQNNGFVDKQVPRYYIPLTFRGKLLLTLHLHRGLRSLIPDRMKPTLRRAKRRFTALKLGIAALGTRRYIIVLHPARVRRENLHSGRGSEITEACYESWTDCENHREQQGSDCKPARSEYRTILDL